MFAQGSSSRNPSVRPSISALQSLKRRKVGPGSTTSKVRGPLPGKRLKIASGENIVDLLSNDSESASPAPKIARQTQSVAAAPLVPPAFPVAATPPVPPAPLFAVPAKNKIDITGVLNLGTMITQGLHYPGNKIRDIFVSLEGLLKNAETKTKIDNFLQEYKITAISLFDQIKTLNPDVLEKIKKYCLLIDYIDHVHDFKRCSIFMDQLNILLVLSELNLTGFQVCGAGDNININRSHELQELCINNIVNILRNAGITVPDIQKEVFLQTDIVTTAQNPYKNGLLFYSESGRNCDPQQEKTVYALADGAGHAGITLDQVMSAPSDKNDEIKDIMDLTHDTDGNLTMSDQKQARKIEMLGGIASSTFDPNTTGKGFFVTVEYKLTKSTGNKLKISTDTNKRKADELMQDTFTLKLKLIKQNPRTANCPGITVNGICSILKSIVGKDFFPNAERGGGSDVIGIEIVSKNFDEKENGGKLLAFMLGLSKLCCDKIDETELIDAQGNPAEFIGNVTTADGYIWAGHFYKWLSGKYRIAPTIYRQTSGGWFIRPGVYNTATETSYRFIRAINLHYWMNPTVSGLFKVPGIIDSYNALLKNLKDVLQTAAYIINNSNTSDNDIYAFLSAIGLLDDFHYIQENYENLRIKLNAFIAAIKNGETGKVLTKLLVEIPFLEDVFAIKHIGLISENQDTLLLTGDITEYRLLRVDKPLADEEESLREFFIKLGYYYHISVPTQLTKEQLDLIEKDIQNKSFDDLNAGINGVSQFLKPLSEKQKLYLDAIKSNATNIRELYEGYKTVKASLDALVTSKRIETTDFTLLTLLSEEAMPYTELLDNYEIDDNGYLTIRLKKQAKYSITVKSAVTRTLEYVEDEPGQYSWDEKTWTLTGQLQMEMLPKLSLLMYNKSKRAEATMSKRLIGKANATMEQYISKDANIMFLFFKSLIPERFNEYLSEDEFNDAYYTSIESSYKNVKVLYKKIFEAFLPLENTFPQTQQGFKRAREGGKRKSKKQKITKQKRNKNRKTRKNAMSR